MFHCPNILMLKITIENVQPKIRETTTTMLNASTLQHKHLETNALLKKGRDFCFVFESKLMFWKSFAICMCCV